MKTLLYVWICLALAGCGTRRGEVRELETPRLGSWGDQGDGSYRNPVLNSNFPDSDVEAFDGKWYMISSGGTLTPGMTILESEDLVNWEITGGLVDSIGWKTRTGVWAGDFVRRDDHWLCYFIDFEMGLFVCWADDIHGPWSAPQLMLARKGSYAVYNGVGVWEPYDGQEEDIARLEQELQSTPEETFGPVPDTVPLDTPYTYALPDGGRIRVRVSQDGLYATAYGAYSGVQPESWVMAGEAYPGEPKGTTLQNVKLTQAEAEAAAEAFLEQAGLTWLGLAGAEKARVLQGMTYETLSEGWQLTYARSDGGCIPVYYENQQSGILYRPAEDYAPRWFPEFARIYVDENGVQSFEWRNPLEIVETMNENVLLLEFDEIREQITQAIEHGYAYMSELMGGGENTVTVDRILLTNVLVPMRDTVEYQMLVPAWVVFYEEDLGLGEPLRDFIAVNAVDGSLVDLQVTPEMM